MSDSKSTVFLSGTDKVEDVLFRLAVAVEEMGMHPLWFHRPDFPILAENALDNCLAVAETCHRLVLIIDSRAGLPHDPTGVTISEAEYNIARSNHAKCLVFVRSRIWHQSRVYHRRLKGRTVLTRDEFKSLDLDGDQGVYEMIERLQHARNGKQQSVPWIHRFDHVGEAETVLRAQWHVTHPTVADGTIRPLPVSRLTSLHADVGMVMHYNLDASYRSKALKDLEKDLGLFADVQFLLSPILRRGDALPIEFDSMRLPRTELKVPADGDFCLILILHDTPPRVDKWSFTVPDTVRHQIMNGSEIPLKCQIRINADGSLDIKLKGRTATKDFEFLKCCASRKNDSNRAYRTCLNYTRTMGQIGRVS